METKDLALFKIEADLIWFCKTQLLFEYSCHCVCLSICACMSEEVQLPRTDTHTHRHARCTY